MLLRVMLLTAAAVFLLLTAQVRLRIETGETLCISVRWLVFTFRLGGKAKKEPKPAAKKEKKPKEKPAKELAPLDITAGEVVDLVCDLISRTWPPLRRMLRSVKLTGIRLRIRVGGADASDVAIGYGKMFGYVAYGQVALYNLFKTVSIEEIAVEPDFLLDSSRYETDITIGIRPIRVLYTVFALIAAVVPIAFRAMRLLTAPKQRRKAARAA